MESGIYACNINSDKLEWMVKGKLDGIENDMDLWGITTDDCGHLFVCDAKNSCVHIFATHGQHMGVACFTLVAFDCNLF